MERVGCRVLPDLPRDRRPARPAVSASPLLANILTFTEKKQKPIQEFKLLFCWISIISDIFGIDKNYLISRLYFTDFHPYDISADFTYSDLQPVHWQENALLLALH